MSNTARYVSLTSANIAIRCFLQRTKTSISGGCLVGPTMRVELSEIPVEEIADASNTARMLVVVLDSLCTTWIGR